MSLVWGGGGDREATGWDAAAGVLVQAPARASYLLVARHSWRGQCAVARSIPLTVSSRGCKVEGRGHEGARIHHPVSKPNNTATATGSGASAEKSLGHLSGTLECAGHPKNHLREA